MVGYGVKLHHSFQYSMVGCMIRYRFNYKWCPVVFNWYIVILIRKNPKNVNIQIDVVLFYYNKVRNLWWVELWIFQKSFRYLNFEDFSWRNSFKGFLSFGNGWLNQTNHWFKLPSLYRISNKHYSFVSQNIQHFQCIKPDNSFQIHTKMR